MSSARLHPDVEQALAAGRAVVALESTILTHGLPRPDNLGLGRRLERVVSEGGAVPATVGVLDGQVHVGLSDAELAALAERADVLKLSVRDLAAAVATGRSGGTTVSATALLAARAGIAVFATGGLGGVHRGAASSRDVSADLDTVARTPITVVCSGVKSLLDVPATLEQLETLGVPVLGYRTDTFPGFYLADTGLPVDWRLEDPAAVARVVREHRALGGGGVLVVNPVPAGAALDTAAHDAALAAALAAAERAGVHGKAVTPFLLADLQQRLGPAAVAANVALVASNAALAARIALALAR
jgi:pseudouridine-5'-phosphate glycosidase